MIGAIISAAGPILNGGGGNESPEMKMYSSRLSFPLFSDLFAKLDQN
jgi:hypothetical protein